MPFTPFHFGPALLIGYPLRRRMDLATFLLANVVTDARAVLVFLDVLSGPLHGPLHNTYLGAFVVAIAFAAVVLSLIRRFPSVANWLSSRPTSAKAVVLASVAGTWLHTTIDAFVHSGMRPFFPLAGNPFYELTAQLSFSANIVFYVGCAIAFVLGVGMIDLSTLRTHWRGFRRAATPTIGIAVGILIAVTVVIAGAGTLTAMETLQGTAPPDVTTERINDTHAAVSWTTDEPTRGYIRVVASTNCDSAWGTVVTEINDSSVTRTHLIVAPVYDLHASQGPLSTTGNDGSYKWYAVKAVTGGETEEVGTTITRRSLSPACR